MADIVRSREMTDIRALSSKFSDVIKNANKRFSKNLLSPLTITLGDEFQGIAASLPAAFEVLQSVNRTLLERDIRCRFVIGEGEILTEINKKVAWNMLGPGLTRCREVLGNKKNPNRIRFAILDSLIEKNLNALGFAATTIEEDWTSHQLILMNEIIDSKTTAAAIAEKRKLNKTGLYRSLRSAKHPLYIEIIGVIEYTLQQISKGR
jgi:DNA-binding phage protein